MLFDEEKSDYDDIATSGESKEIERAEKKAAKKAAKESKKRAKLLKEAEKLGFTPEMLGDDFGKEMSLEEILGKKSDSEKNEKTEKSEDKTSGDKTEVKTEEKSDNKSDDKDGLKLSDDKAKDENSSEDKTDKEEKAEEDTSKKKKKRGRKERDPHYNIVKELLTTIIYMGGVILLVFILHTYVGQKVVVDGSSMNPTLENEDNLWVDKLRYKVTDPQRFDVIVFPYRKGSDILFIKRIIGLPDETVQIDNGNIYINGELLVEQYGNAPMIDPGVASSKVVLAHDEYFVLGDNRNNSNDSRKSDVGNIKRENIMGKAVLRLTPFKQFGDFDKIYESESE